MATVSKYQTASGTTLYRVRYRTPKRAQTDKRGFTTKRAAEEFAAAVEVTMARGEYVAPSLGRVTVGQLGPGWLARKKCHLKPSAYRSYEIGWRVHVEPRWRAVQLGAIRYTAVQAWIAELSKTMSPSRVNTVYAVLAGILDDAVRDRMLAANPARGVKRPRPRRRQNVYLSAEQLRALAIESGRYGSLVLLLGVAGLRWGEAAALRVSDVDFLRRRVVLHENAVAVGGRVHVGTLKSGRNRTVALPGFVVDELAATCAGKGRGELIWTGRDGGYLAPPGARSWRRVRCATARLPTRRSRGSQHTLCGTPRRRWLSQPGRM